MDHDDDPRNGPDDLSRLFGTGTAPLPAVTTEEPARAPRDRLDDPSPSAFGSPLPPLYAPPPLIAPSFGAPASGAPLPGAPASAPLLTQPPVAPYAPPSLVPAPSLSTSTPSSFAPVSGPPPAAPPVPQPAAPIAPAFGGVPIAVREAPPVPTPELLAAGGAPRDEAVAVPVQTPSHLADHGPIVSAPVPMAAALAPPPPAAPSAAPPPDAPAYSGRGPLLPGGSTDDIVDEEQVARSTLAEKIFFVLTILLPPIGLIGTAVAAVGSSRRRGWVIGLLRAGLAIGVVMSVVSAGAAYVGYKEIRQQQAHAQTAAASAAFCAAFAKDKTLGAPDGGWPQPAASIPDSLTTMQAYVDRWSALAKISPDGIRQGSASVAAAGTEVMKSVQVQRTIDDAQNRPVLVSAVTSAGIADWRTEYCE